MSCREYSRHANLVGMFLFARVILENLMEQECEEDVFTELRDDVFPSELDEA
jgi:hypothetical protein